MPDETVMTPILVVDDDPAILEAMVELLEDYGYGVHTALSGRAAIDLLASGLQPALMIVDYAMPGLNGLDVLDACAAIPGLGDVPFVLTSAFPTGEVPLTPRVSYLAKPFSIGDLIARIRQLTGRERG